MTITRRAVLAGGLSLAVLPLRAQLVGAQQAAAPVRELTPLAGPVYRFRNNFHYSVVVVTHEGVMATDPINADAARWLKAEIAKSFSQPVRFLVYSHDHADHISGGEVFADTARIVAHENARRTIIAEKRPTAVPQVTFIDRMVIELGGTTIELSHVGRNHSDNSIVMRFPTERILFAVDFIPVSRSGSVTGRMPTSRSGSSPSGAWSPWTSTCSSLATARSGRRATCAPSECTWKSSGTR